jgi:hypothetical protein
MKRNHAVLHKAELIGSHYLSKELTGMGWGNRKINLYLNIMVTEIRDWREKRHLQTKCTFNRKSMKFET